MSKNKVFETISINKPKRNVFDLSHEVKLSFNMGELIPFLCKEVIPGDKFIVDSEVLVRFQPLLAPLMHRVDVYTHFFFVPNRLVWTDWEEFITGGEDGLCALSVPVLEINDANIDDFVKGRLPDYLGIPVTNPSAAVVQDYSISCLPFRAYLEIYNEYYRDQNLIDPISLVSATSILTQLRTRAWEKDYFTSALPWTQRGSEVELPLGDIAPIVPKTSGGSATYARKYSGGSPTAGSVDVGTGAGDNLVDTSATPTSLEIFIEANREVDLTGATGSTINELRRATKLQQWLEGMARGGSRYTEQLLHMFGVKSSDARLQRPEYLGGGKQPVVISEVVNTAGIREHDSNIILDPQGQMVGHAMSIGKSNEFSAYFEEHGHVMGIISVMPRTGYAQGIEKMFLRHDKEDFYWQQFAQLGEQEVQQQELWVDYANVNDIDETFGYQMRYAEYKHSQDRVTGDFRDDFDFWHLIRQFSAKPTLNQAFIECDPSHRIFAVTDPSEDKLFAQIYNKVKAVRPMPYFNVPTL